MVFIAIKQWGHLLLTLSGYNTLCQLKCLKWPEHPFIMWGIHSQEAFPASVILSGEKGRTPGRCAGGSRSLDRGRHLWNFHPTDGNGADRVLRSLAGRGAGMFESQLLFLMRLCDLAPLFLAALPFIFLSCQNISLQRSCSPPRPKWVEHGGNWTYKKHKGIKTQALLTHLQCQCHPYLVHRPSERRGLSGIWPGTKGSSRWALGSLIFLWA